jgi:hypothetical protein
MIHVEAEGRDNGFGQVCERARAYQFDVPVKPLP